MKIRNGFVSNSSSSSFIIAKSYMTNEQIDGFKKEIDIFKKDKQRYLDPYSDYKYENAEVYLYEYDCYFVGQDHRGHGDVFEHIIKLLGLEKYIHEEF